MALRARRQHTLDKIARQYPNLRLRPDISESQTRRKQPGQFGIKNYCYSHWLAA